jgi:phospho-N-acetylmuramoyl-pentapeptide-transferase
MSEAAMALSLGGITFLLTVIWGGPFIRILRIFGVGEQIRIEGPERHFSKLGTPTMGGILFIVPILLITGVLNLVSIVSDLNILGNSILLPLITMVLYAGIGAWDDWLSIRSKKHGGLRARWKFLLQLLVAFGAAMVLKFGLEPRELILPSFGEPIELGLWYIPIAMFVIVSSTNAVNLTDGLDGLAGMITATAFAGISAIAMLQGQVFLVRFGFTVVGAVFAFLWYNAYPAELFMGDTGSLALGGTLGVVALMTGQWILLPVIAIIPASETLSVILQVIYFKITKGRRLFRMAPLHNHFELLGWSETQIVQRFWLVALLTSMFGVALALI